MTEAVDCPHCGHDWERHWHGRCGCGCMWSKPVPPPEPPNERDLLVARIARLLYDGVRESCDGYVEGFEQYGDTDPSEEVVDGRVDFPAFAKHVIDELGLTPDEVWEWKNQ